MPLYEYHCQACDKDFEELLSYEARDLMCCSGCGALADRKMSTFSWKWDNIFTKDGEGFTSTTYPHDEYKRRVATNAGKDDVYHRDFE